jgi:hypothetical protein
MELSSQLADNYTYNNVSSTAFVSSYVELITDIRRAYPHAQIILMSLWKGFKTVGNTYVADGAWVQEIYRVYEIFNQGGYGRGYGRSGRFVHYFNTTGILQHHDIGPHNYLTHTGRIKIVSHLLQYFKMKYHWTLAGTGM